MNTTNVPTEWFSELKRLSELAYINEDVDSLRLAEINGQIKAHINCLKYFNQPEQSSELEEFQEWFVKESNFYSVDKDGIEVPFSEVYKAFKNREK